MRAQWPQALLSERICPTCASSTRQDFQSLEIEGKYDPSLEAVSQRQVLQGQEGWCQQPLGYANYFSFSRKRDKDKQKAASRLSAWWRSGARWLSLLIWPPHCPVFPQIAPRPQMIRPQKESKCLIFLPFSFPRHPQDLIIPSPRWFITNSVSMQYINID